MEESSPQLFLQTLPQNIIIPDVIEQSYFGILDIRPDKITAAPRFTEPATLQAMSNLGIMSSDFVPQETADFEQNNDSLRIQIQIELEKRRLASIERVIIERQHILNNKIESSDLTQKCEKTKVRKKKAKKKKAKHSKKSNESPPQQKQQVQQSKLPRLKRTKNKVESNALPTNRRIKPKSIIDERMERASKAKAINEEIRISNAIKALKKVVDVEKRQKEIRMRQQEVIKEKARLRMKKLQKKDEKTEFALNKRKEDAYKEMVRQEKQYYKIQERERKKYELEHKKRIEKIYGKVPTKKQSNSNLAELRKKILCSKLAENGCQSSPSKSRPGLPSFSNLPPLPPKPLLQKSYFIPKISPIVPVKGSHIPYLRVRK